MCKQALSFSGATNTGSGTSTRSNRSDLGSLRDRSELGSMRSMRELGGVHGSGSVGQGKGGGGGAGAPGSVVPSPLEQQQQQQQGGCAPGRSPGPSASQSPAKDTQLLSDLQVGHELSEATSGGGCPTGAGAGGTRVSGMPCGSADPQGPRPRALQSTRRRRLRLAPASSPLTCTHCEGRGLGGSAACEAARQEARNTGGRCLH